MTDPFWPSLVRSAFSFEHYYGTYLAKELVHRCGSPSTQRYTLTLANTRVLRSQDVVVDNDSATIAGFSPASDRSSL